jgi:dTDP-4-amino-4,6-dideoxygalactose transaminase
MSQENPIEWPIESKSAKDNVLRALRNRRWWSREGEFVRKFQESFADFLQVKHVFCCSNGTVALETALKSLDIGLLDYVIVPNITFIATATSVLKVGAIPLFADIDPATACIDLSSIKKLEAKYPGKIKAIILVHFGGQCCDIVNICNWARTKNIYVVEDCAQAIGTRCQGKHVGGFGDVGCFSFQNSKNISSGEGGAVVTNDQDLAVRLNKFLDHNFEISGNDAEFKYLSSNYRLSEFQAAVLLAQLEGFDTVNNIRESNYYYLAELLSNVSGIVVLKNQEKMTSHGCHFFMFRYKSKNFNNRSKEDFINYLKTNGVPCWSGYEHIPLDRFPYFSKYLYIKNDPLWRELYRMISFPLPEGFPCSHSYDLVDEFVWIPQFFLLREKSLIGRTQSIIDDFRNLAKR